MSFLPISKKDMEINGYKELDFLFISGDAYIDHPSFGHAIITRVLEDEGYKVGIIAQPDPEKIEDFTRLGKPRLGVLISSGVIDSMVNHYTASKKVRNNDSYSPGGKAGYRPDRAIIVYSNKIRQAFKGIPIIIGGVEAGLRRFAHYDYWDDKVRRSILQDSRADLIVYGMGEKSIVEIAQRLADGESIENINDVRGTAYISNLENLDNRIKSHLESNEKLYKDEMVLVPSFEEVSMDKVMYAKAFRLQYDEQDPFRGKTIIQKHSERYVIQNPPAFPMTQDEIDKVYSLKYERTYHPSYEAMGGVPAIQEVEFSITDHRGCYGGCSFCSITFHQGRIIQKRSKESIINEAKKFISNPEFKGYIHDLGGPTANFRNPACQKQLTQGACKDKQCLFPAPCKNLKVDHSEYFDILRELRKLDGIKKVFIRSGIRYDYLLLEKNDKYLNELIENHVSGQLKIAPEHICDNVLQVMGKPGKDVFEKFEKKFKDINERLGLKQFLVPYMISSHPGSTLNDAIELAVYLKKKGYRPEQVQDFYPTPGTLSTCIFYTEIDPYTMEHVYVPKNYREKMMQRALLQFTKRENYNIVEEALKLAGREDLIGFEGNCLIKPRREKFKFEKGNGKSVNKSDDKARKNTGMKTRAKVGDKYGPEKEWKPGDKYVPQKGLKPAAKYGPEKEWKPGDKYVPQKGSKPAAKYGPKKDWIPGDKYDPKKGPKPIAKYGAKKEWIPGDKYDPKKASKPAVKYGAKKDLNAGTKYTPQKAYSKKPYKKK